MENTLNFYHLTDLHYYAADVIDAHGDAYEFKRSLDQKCMAESGAIIDATFDKLIDDKDNQVVVITGDNTFDGEVQSHDSLVLKLRKLKEAGKKVYITFATHDFNMVAKGYNENGEYLVEKYDRQQLRNLYNEFGWTDSIAEHVPSYSYAVKPFDGYRFLMLNDDGDGLEFCGYYNDLLEWIKNQAEDAKANGEKVIAFTHHPVLPPTKGYPLYSYRDMLGGFETTGPFLADCGIEFVFTGHTHMQSISLLKTEKNNKLYHINTGSAIAYPLPYRKINICDKGLHVTTQHIDHFDWPLNDKSVLEYSKDQFNRMLNDIAYSLAYDLDKFKLLAKGFSLSENTIERFKILFIALGKLLNNLTFSSVGKLLLISNKIDKSVANIKLKDFVIELLTNLYEGNKPYTPDTKEYIAFMAIIKRIKVFIKPKNKQGEQLDLEDLMADILYNTNGMNNTECFLEF